MKFEILCSRGAGVYLVSRDEEYCLVNLATGKYNANEEAGVFLKFGYFEDVEPDQLPQTVTEQIGAVLADPEARVEIH